MSTVTRTQAVEVQQALLTEKIEQNAQVIAAVAAAVNQMQDQSKALQNQLNSNDATIEMSEKKIQQIDAKNQRLKIVLGLLCAGLVVTIGAIGITRLLKP